MARETNAQRREREAQENAVYEAQCEQQYLTKLMAALEEATTQANYELKVVKGLFELHDRNGDSWRDEVTLGPTYTSTNWTILEQLEWDLQRKAEERAEATRRHMVKQAALAKLSKEEKELLGL